MIKRLYKEYTRSVLGNINYSDVFEVKEITINQEYLDKLNSAPAAAYLQSREIRKGSFQSYLPIPVQEATADMMFSEWDVVDERFDILVNELVCTVKIRYVPSYPSATERITTGSAAKAITMAKGSTVADFPANKNINSLESVLPAVKSMAKGNAFENIGNIFGRNVGRKIDGKLVATNFSFRIKKAEVKDENK
jgi:hypothetical protein